MELEFLKSLVIIFGISAVLIFVLDKLKTPSIIGFLIAGVLLGPNGLVLIEDRHMVEVFAEIGIVFLLFTIGLEFSLQNFLSMKRTILLGGTLQISLIVFFVASILYLFNFPVNSAILFGLLLSLSSTAIVMNLLFARAEIDTSHGRTSIAILIFQDFCAVLFMLMIPLLAGTNQGYNEYIEVLLKSFIIITGVIVSARWLVPKILYQIVRSQNRELFIITNIFICLGAAFLTYELGLSLALGAFIAGLIISESEYSYQVISDVLPFKDSFNGLFFISVGMLLDPVALLNNLHVVLGIVIFITFIKIVSSTAAISGAGLSLKISLHTSFLIAQVGEFSFLLAVSAMKNGILSENHYQLFLSASILTMMLTPLWFAISPVIAERTNSMKLLKLFGREKRDHFEEETNEVEKTDHVIIIGYGINGRNLTLVLDELEVPYIILELNGQTVREMREKEVPICYGDGTSLEILHKLGIEKAHALVITIPDPSAIRRIVSISRRANPNIFIIVRTRFINEVEDLLSLGADEVIPEEFETSIELFSRVLKFYRMPNHLIEGYVERIRDDHYTLFINQESPKKILHDTIALMPDIEIEGFLVGDESPLKDVRLSSIDTYSETFTFIMAVKRGSMTYKNPDSNFLFSKGDIVFFAGTGNSLKKARDLYSNAGN